MPARFGEALLEPIKPEIKRRFPPGHAFKTTLYDINPEGGGIGGKN